jgi:peptidyl-dipeptidase A
MSEALARFTERITARVEPIETGANLAYWDFTTTGQPEDEQRYVRLQVALRHVFADRAAFAEFRSLTDAQLPADPLLARQATLLRYQFLGNQMDEQTIQELTEREAAIESTFNTFRADLAGRRVTENEIKEILRESEDVGLRRQAWEASKQIGVQVAERLLELVQLRNRIAHQIGFPDYYRMRLTLQELDEAEMFDLFDKLDEQAHPIYAAYKTGLDADLAARFGIAAQDLRPWHYSDPFFQEAPAGDPAVRGFLSLAYTSQDIAALTHRFYRALGLDVDDIMARSDLYERDGKQQHAYCIHTDRKGDVRVLCNVKPNHRWMGTMLHEFGHAVYDKYLDRNLPYLLRQPAHTLFTEAVAMMMGRLASDADWITTYIPAQAPQAGRISGKLRQYAAGELLIMSRWVPVMSHFERALYWDPHQDLNKLWWDLEEHYQGVKRPEGRDAPDWAAKIHLSTAPVYYHNYLLGELIASQVRDEIERSVLGSSDGEVNQRFVTEPAVGRYLSEKVFRPGAVRHWQEALEHATGERLQPGYFVADAAV